MDSPKRPRQPEDNRSSYPKPGYGSGSYGYSGYGYGYGYPGASETTVQKTLQDYFLILRERVWFIVIAFLVVFGGALVFTFTQTPIYQATVMVEIFRRAPMALQVQQVMDSEVRSAEDLNTQINILKSETLVEQVANRLRNGDRQRFLAPYIRPGKPSPQILSILLKNREIVPQRLSLDVAIQYLHPDKAIAAEVANLFADQYIAYNAHIAVDESMKVVEDLDQRANEQRKKVDDIAASIQTYREKNNLVSLDQRQDIVTEKLKELDSLVTQSAASLQEAETRWRQVVAYKQKGLNLLDMPFIASVPTVSQLQQQVATLKINVSQLSQRYRPGHPQMIAAMDSLKAAQTELKHAIDITTAQVQSDYQDALQNYTRAQSALAQQESDSLRLDRYGLEYANLERDYDINEKLLEHILERMRETSMSTSVENENSRIIDRAEPPQRPYSPNYTLNLGLGAVSGVFVGVALAFFAAYVDDRVKSSFDIETVVGLPLLGIIPEIKKQKKLEEADQILSERSNREVSEAFSTLLSTLQLKDESKNAQCVLVTSTIASEGKSFITSNLAQTYASHGDRVVIVDCDLRRPAVNRLYQLENLKGVIDVCTTGALLDDVIVKEVRPNLDIIPTGGRAKNPGQLLNSKAFAQMISELRKRYTRIFIDTPPVAIVSDAFLVLPVVDGSIYSIYFNKVRRKAAQFCAHRLLEINVPNFGAVLNGLPGGMGGYYYHHYYHKSYKDYYVTMEEGETGDGPKIASPTRPRSGPSARGSRLGKNGPPPEA